VSDGPRRALGADVVDCHVHLLPGRLGEKVREFFTAHISGSLAYPNDHGAVLDSLAAAGVSLAWHLPYAHKPGVAVGLNVASAELVSTWRSHPVSLVGGIAVHPGDESPSRLVGSAVDDLDLRVVKLHCSVGGFEVDDPRLEQMWQLVASRSVPVVVHAGHAVSGETRAGELNSIDRVAARFPSAPIVIAHAAHPDTTAAVEVVERHDNVYVDLTPRVVDMVDVSDEVLERLHERVLFGSDLPNTQVTIEANLSRLSTLSTSARTAIAFSNARRLVPMSPTTYESSGG
jgi:predicted TIM-barrel fold metal-dependent hydrolase